MNQPEQVAFEKTYNLWQTSAPSANVKHAFREGHDMGWKNAIKHISRPGEAVSNYSQAELGEGLGPNAQDVARESVDDALMIVASYGPWGADLNDAHRRQIVLADEVHRLRHLYEMAVHGRAEMRAALRQERDGPGSDDYFDCEALVAAGLMTKRKGHREMMQAVTAAINETTKKL